MSKENPATVGQTAQQPQPAVEAPLPPRRTERQGARTVPYTKMYPLIRGGQCEYCGTVDPNQPAIYQYKLCPHFRGMGDIQCSYCDPTKDPNEVLRYSVTKVHDHPYEKDEYGRPTLVVVCDTYECSRKHEARFDITQ